MIAWRHNERNTLSMSPSFYVCLSDPSFSLSLSFLSLHSPQCRKVCKEKLHRHSSLDGWLLTVLCLTGEKERERERERERESERERERERVRERERPLIWKARKQSIENHKAYTWEGLRILSSRNMSDISKAWNVLVAVKMNSFRISKETAWPLNKYYCSSLCFMIGQKISTLIGHVITALILIEMLLNRKIMCQLHEV